MIPHIVTDSAITAVIGGRTYSVPRTNSYAERILKAIRGNELTRVILDMFDKATQVRKFLVRGNVEIQGNTLLYNKEPVHGLIVDRILESLENNWPAEPLLNFLDKLMLNPSRNSVQQLYGFLEKCGLVLCPDGDFLGYKGVQKDYWSKSSGSKTAVLHGKVDLAGRILNAPGHYIEVVRNYVCDDPRQSCAPGLHVGTWDYASSFGSRVVLVKVNPKDVVSVPETEAEKLRAAAYNVVQDCGVQITSPNWEEDDENCSAERLDEDLDILVPECQGHPALCNNENPDEPDLPVKYLLVDDDANGVQDVIALEDDSEEGSVVQLYYTLKSKNIDLDIKGFDEFGYRTPIHR